MTLEQKIKATEELTGYKRIKPLRKGKIIFYLKNKWGRKFRHFYFEVWLPEEMYGFVHVMSMDSLLEGAIIPFEWLKPLAEIWGENNE